MVRCCQRLPQVVRSQIPRLRQSSITKFKSTMSALICERRTMHTQLALSFARRRAVHSVQWSTERSPSMNLGHHRPEDCRPIDTASLLSILCYSNYQRVSLPHGPRGFFSISLLFVEASKYRLHDEEENDQGASPYHIALWIHMGLFSTSHYRCIIPFTKNMTVKRWKRRETGYDYSFLISKAKSKHGLGWARLV